MSVFNARRNSSLLIAIIITSLFGGCFMLGIINVGPVNLKSAEDFVILAKTAVSNVPTSNITGDIGLSPAAESYFAGFAHTDALGYATSAQVTGKLYASDMAVPTPAKMTTAISDMEAAYTAAAGRNPTADGNLGAGTISGMTLEPGIYAWGSTVYIGTNLTLSGGLTDFWIFQISGDLTLASGAEIILSGGAHASNIFWQVAGEATVGSGAHIEGTILCQTAIKLNTGASMNGRALAQTQVILDQNLITDPGL